MLHVHLARNPARGGFSGGRVRRFAHSRVPAAAIALAPAQVKGGQQGGSAVTTLTL